MIINNDCLDEMRKMEDNSISCIVTDPPYGLGFMGKEWDAGLPHDEIWKQVLRITKPGGYLLAFGGTRTYHRLTCAIEDAGWEIRDCLMWIYGSGFPKNLDINKSIDKKRKDDPRPICKFLRDSIEKSGKTTRQIASFFGFHARMVEHWAARDTDSQPTVPTIDQWFCLKEYLHFSSEMDEEVIRLNERKGKWGDAAIERGFIETTGSLHKGTGNTVGCFTGKQLSSNPVTDLSKRFFGYGTALKPAYEPIIMAMKPCDGTFAQNAEKWGQAGINIDGCRIDYENESDKMLAQSSRPSVTKEDCYSGGFKGLDRSDRSALKGRWPANIMFDEEAAKMLDEQSGQLKSIPFSSPSVGFHDCLGRSKKLRKDGPRGFTDSGGASRFFYCAKTSSSERGEFNKHPTVKPLKLMRYLITLIMPPKDGILLDPFAGSGSTILAAHQLGLKAIGIEKSAEYCEIARKRIESWKPEKPEPDLFDAQSA